MKICFIFNPRSGRHARNARLFPQLREFIAARALDASLMVTEGAGHATELARDAVHRGCLRVIAVGGDGTMNEVAQAVAHTPATLALIPCGSGNGLALHLGIPLKASAALELATSNGRVAAIDTGEANGKPFFNAMGLGLDADVSRRFNQLTRRGLPAYARTAFSAFYHRKSEHCTVSTATRREPIETLLIAVANSDQYGNRAYIAPGARVDDGHLDLVAIRPVTIFGAIAIGAHLFLGSIDRSPSIRRLRGSRFIIERPAPGLIHTDGETHQTGATVEVVVRPHSLRVVVPATCASVALVDELAPAGFALQLP